MFPVLFEVLGVPIGSHEVFVALGLGVALCVFAIERRRRRIDDPRLWSVVAVSLAWGAVLIYLGTWFQHVDLSENAGLVEQFLYGNRSILGGLLGAYLGAHVGKRVTGYRPAPAPSSPPRGSQAWRSAGYDPLRLCIFANVALLGWLGGPWALTFFAGMGFVGYWMARRGGLLRSKCLLRDTRLVLLYLAALVGLAIWAIIRQAGAAATALEPLG